MNENNGKSMLLYEMVKQSIKGEIAQGSYAIGDKIPSERIISQTYSVSRITAKKALADLHQEGVLERREGRKGMFVSDPTRKDREEISLIAVVIDDIRDDFGAEILRGIEDYLWSQKIHTVICDVDRNFQKVEEYFNSLLQQQISGVIFAPVIDIGYYEKNRALLSILDRAQIPYTLIDRYIPGILSNYVGIDHHESARTMTRYLLSNGYRRILLVCGLECSSMDERCTGYLEAHQEQGIDVHQQSIISINENLLHGPTEAEVLEQLNTQIQAIWPVDAIYALNDRVLAAVMSVVAQEPQYHTALLVSHSKVNPLHFPGFTNLPHFDEPTYEMGQQAAELLLDIIRDPKPMVVKKILVCDFIEKL